jgi:hypothetical protein
VRDKCETKNAEMKMCGKEGEKRCERGVINV